MRIAAEEGINKVNFPGLEHTTADVESPNDDVVDAMEFDYERLHPAAAEAPARLTKKQHARRPLAVQKRVRKCTFADAQASKKAW